MRFEKTKILYSREGERETHAPTGRWTDKEYYMETDRVTSKEERYINNQTLLNNYDKKRQYNKT